jgi:amidase
MIDPFLDATAQAELVRRGDVTPQELVESAIERIERLDPTLNAVVHPTFERARDVAAGQVADPALALGDGPFRGVPFLVKNAVCHTAGDPYTCGMRVLKDRHWTEPTDTWLAARFRAAGFVFVGKTNAPELATSATTEPLAFGATRNPWDLRRSPGGSSGGSGAAVAAGLVPVAHGNDMGGSIRIPAAACGLVGLKPTRARSTLGPSFGEYWGNLTHEHVLTRSVRDTAAVLDAIAGRAPGDPYSARPPVRPFAEEVGADPGRLRIGLLPGVPTTEAEVVATVEAVGRLLEGLGHHVEASFPEAVLDRDSGATGMAWIGPAVARDLDRWSRRLGVPIGPDDVEPANWWMAENGRRRTVVEQMETDEVTNGWVRRMAAWWAGGFDVLVMPTMPAPAIELGTASPDLPLETMMPVIGRVASLTSAWNVTGQPAISLPLGWSSPTPTCDTLPIGVQFVADDAREDVLIRLAAQLEEALPWSHRRPPVSASSAG